MLTRKIFIALFILTLMAMAKFMPTSQPTTQTAYALTNPSALAQSTGFPSDQAGLTAVIKVDPIDYARLSNVMSRLIEVEGSDGATFMWGKIAITHAPNGWLQYTIGLYADINGVIVTFLFRDNAASKLIYWSGQKMGNQNTLQVAMGSLVKELGLPSSVIDQKISYYHFGYPQATSLTLFAIARNKQMSLLVPKGITLSEISYSGVLIESINVNTQQLKLNVSEISQWTGYLEIKPNMGDKVPTILVDVPYDLVVKQSCSECSEFTVFAMVWGRE